jgi:predicted RNase H-like HicB family nuclease
MGYVKEVARTLSSYTDTSIARHEHDACDPTVTSPAMPGLIAEGESVHECIENAWEALLALLDAYVELGRPLPFGLPPAPSRLAVHFEHLIAA